MAHKLLSSENTGQPQSGALRVNQGPGIWHNALGPGPLCSPSREDQDP